MGAQWIAVYLYSNTSWNPSLPRRQVDYGHAQAKAVDLPEERGHSPPRIIRICQWEDLPAA
jgi:hypothetical protein